MSAFTDLFKFTAARTPGIRSVLRRVDLRTTNERNEDAAVEQFVRVMRGSFLTRYSLNQVITMQPGRAGYMDWQITDSRMGASRIGKVHDLIIAAPQHPGKDPYSMQQCMDAGYRDHSWNVTFNVWGMSARQRAAIQAGIDALINEQAFEHLRSATYERNPAGTFIIKIETHLRYEPTTYV